MSGSIKVSCGRVFGLGKFVVCSLSVGVTSVGVAMSVGVGMVMGVGGVVVVVVVSMGVVGSVGVVFERAVHGCTAMNSN